MKFYTISEYHDRNIRLEAIDSLTIDGNDNLVIYLRGGQKIAVSTDARRHYDALRKALGIGPRHDRFTVDIDGLTITRETEHTALQAAYEDYCDKGTAAEVNMSFEEWAKTVEHVENLRSQYAKVMDDLEGTADLYNSLDYRTVARPIMSKIDFYEKRLRL